MLKYSFIAKNLNLALGTTNSKFNFSFMSPLFCPICNRSQGGTLVTSKLYNAGHEGLVAVVQRRCNLCLMEYLEVIDINTEKQLATFANFHPSTTLAFEDEVLADISERFIMIYNQALHAESINDYELAAIGYRTALEILVKDYAINELQKNEEEVSKKKLAAAIEAYLDSELIKSGDVVRILGNDYAHYKREYMEYDFTVLKRYMEIFINLIRVKIMIAHPPVAKQETMGGSKNQQ